MSVVSKDMSENEISDAMNEFETMKKVLEKALGAKTNMPHIDDRD